MTCSFYTLIIAQYLNDIFIKREKYFCGQQKANEFLLLLFLIKRWHKTCFSGILFLRKRIFYFSFLNFENTKELLRPKIWRKIFFSFKYWYSLERNIYKLHSILRCAQYSNHFLLFSNNSILCELYSNEFVLLNELFIKVDSL